MPPRKMPQRKPVPTMITLANATRARRPAGMRQPTALEPFGSHASAVALLEPLGLAQPLYADELDDLEALANETRAIAEALAGGRRPPSIAILNRLAAQTRAIRSVQFGPDGGLTTDVHWHAPSAVAELACRVVDEIGHLDPSRLRYCAREACDLLFYDTTRGRTQRWHSESPCGIRERQDRWRKTAAGPATA